MSETHHLDVFRDDAKHTWGYQCFTCGHVETNFVSFLAAEAAADEHPGACTCEVH